VDVSIGRSQRPRETIALHRALLADDEITTVDGIPVTTVARTLLDLAADLPQHQLERVMDEAEIQRRGDSTGLNALIERYPRRCGTRALRRRHRGPALRMRLRLARSAADRRARRLRVARHPQTVRGGPRPRSHDRRLARHPGHGASATSNRTRSPQACCLLAALVAV